MSGAEKAWRTEPEAEVKIPDCGDPVTGILSAPVIPPPQPRPPPQGGEPTSVEALEQEHTLPPLLPLPVLRQYILSAIIYLPSGLCVPSEIVLFSHVQDIVRALTDGHVLIMEISEVPQPPAPQPPAPQPPPVQVLPLYRQELVPGMFKMPTFGLAVNHE